MTDYDALKTEILSRNGLTKFGRAQHLHSWTFQPDQPPCAQMHELVRITRKWLEPEKSTAAAVVEAIVVDRYIRALPYEAKTVHQSAGLDHRRSNRGSCRKVPGHGGDASCFQEGAQECIPTPGGRSLSIEPQGFQPRHFRSCPGSRESQKPAGTRKSTPGE